MGARWEFAGGIEKLVGNIPRDRQRKTVRLAARMSEAAGLAGFAKRFAEGIGKVAGNTPRDHRKKTERLTSRMPEAVGLAGMRSWFSLLVIKSCNH
ncbi:hypothetical protein BHE74_00052715 [Ensete ventricosum]|nr:hypothetical protein BHE74_00052715 [Ensete ventricosum]RZR87363.1 hypothetical protein BHM03_00014760 [Ensete ventricosum]